MQKKSDTPTIVLRKHLCCLKGTSESGESDCRIRRQAGYIGYSEYLAFLSSFLRLLYPINRPSDSCDASDCKYGKY
jgi:hypothetical protein